MVLRLAEQYLIRAEARAKQDMLEEAIEDLDIVRQRAGLELISEINPTIRGHRWFDLKRIEKADEVLGDNNPLWETTDVLYPIPSEDRKRNPNLTQNLGY